MKHYFEELMGTQGVLGLLLLSPEGAVHYKADPANLLLARPVDEIAVQLVSALTDAIQEVDMVFSEQRVYLRWTPLGPLLVLLTRTAPIAMVRLHCDTLIPTLKPPERASGLKRFFGKWR
jgi:hypothetical protein